MSGRICLYYRRPPEVDRWIPGDRFVRPIVRRVLRGKPRMGGVEKMFANLCEGLDRAGVRFEVNLPFRGLRAGDRIGVLGRGRAALAGYDRPFPLVAGIGLMGHPSEWPDLCTAYPVMRYLQHSEWTDAVYRPFFGDRCAIWPVGIDTQHWSPGDGACDLDVLVYDKIYWERAQRENDLIQPLLKALSSRGLKFASIRYGDYEPEQYRRLLRRSRAMLFLSAHESQGLAYQEALSCGVPVLAWDQGHCLDPQRFAWSQPEIRATSVPYFDARCGERFRDVTEFEPLLEIFLQRLSANIYQPREYVLEHLELANCAQRFMDILDQVACEHGNA